MYDEVIAVFFFFKQKTAYEMRISDWSSDVCSSDLGRLLLRAIARVKPVEIDFEFGRRLPLDRRVRLRTFEIAIFIEPASDVLRRIARQVERRRRGGTADGGKIGRAHVLTPVTNAHLVCRLLLEKKTK